MQKFTPGNLVHYRNRDWMVLPSDDEDVLMIKPLGGSEEEITGVFLPLAREKEKLSSATFPQPNINQIGSFETAKLLFNAARLSLRDAAGPFRAMAKLSFRPRAYQIVPLVMALKQDVTRLLIADDVGIGKTIEALIIIKELIERGEIKRFAVICPPHLCEQWQKELKDKLDIDAEIIRSSTAAKLDRMIADDRSVFYHIPYQVISIDYIKSDRRRNMFIQDCPEMVVVDEAHICALPSGAQSVNQQQRHSLINEIAKDENRHFVMLTATPHSGKDEEFLSLLGLLKPELRQLNFEEISTENRRKLANYFIQRKREHVKSWMDEETLFPERDSKEVGFTLSISSRMFYNELVNFAKVISENNKEDTEGVRLVRSWAAIALIKGAMSSPATAIKMLENKLDKIDLEEEEELLDENAIKDTLFEENDFGADFVRSDLLQKVDYKEEEKALLENLIKSANDLMRNPDEDTKLKHSIEIIKKWIKEGFQPIIFCHYIETANYVAEELKKALPKNVQIQGITSEMGDEQRKEEVENLGKSKKRVLVATDCLSEGINLQDYFDAVLHYDLPWNPNRIEQREGRVDRFGQSSSKTKAYMLYGENNPMDKFILEVLIRKVKEIQKSIGVTIPIGENNKSLMAELTQKILKEESEDEQLKLFENDQIKIKEDLEKARKKGIRLRDIFAHKSVDPEIIKKDLEEVNEAIGDIKTVEDFVKHALDLLGVVNRKVKNVYKLQLTNLPVHLRMALLTIEEQKAKLDSLLISFDSPTPKGAKYIGRNHKFVEQLCQFVLANAFENENKYGLARTGAVRVAEVEMMTTLVMFRVRNVVKEVQSKIESVAEEMFLWAYESQQNEIRILDYKKAKELLLHAVPISDISLELQKNILKTEFESFENKKEEFIKIATERADKLVEAHGRFKSLIGGRRYEKSTPVLPPDVMGVYILLPPVKALNIG